MLVGHKPTEMKSVSQKRGDNWECRFAEFYTIVFHLEPNTSEILLRKVAFILEKFSFLEK
jgi:hypothetical protein